MSVSRQTGKRPPGERVRRLFHEFAGQEASGGMVLLACAVASLAWANSPWAGAYEGLWQIEVVVGSGNLVLAKPLLAWINDGLMALFFFVVGLEIKREILVGELSEGRQAALPVAAAVGGMLVPAALYTALNVGREGARGWGIPMATDIAFALGVLAVLGRRVPLALKVFLAALAIADDLGAVLVIALFYAAQVHWFSLAVAAGVLLVLMAANRVGTRHTLLYGLLGLALWVAFLKSGVHSTVAGVLLAMTIPARARLDPDQFVAHGYKLLAEFERHGEPERQVFLDQDRQAAVQALETACHQVETPLQRMERGLLPWVTFGVVPLFALANAGVGLGEHARGLLADPVSLGIAAGLVIGKPLGIISFAWLAVTAGLARLPQGASWAQVAGVGCLAGIGFTMSLLLADLSFGGTTLLPTAKAAILGGSLVAGLLGWLLLFLSSRGNAEGRGCPGGEANGA